MKRLVVPALALGLAIAFVQPASAGGLLDKLCHRNSCDPCKPACPDPCAKKLCLPKISLCKPCCPKPACDPCGCGCHKLGSKLKGLVHGIGHKHCGSSCGSPCGAPAEAAPAHGHSSFESPRLTPIPTGYRTSMRSAR